MKDNIDLMAMFASISAALLRGLKQKLSKRATIINMIVAGVLSFGVVSGLLMYLPKWIENPRAVVFIAFIVGWISNDFTDRLDQVVGDAYDLVKAYFKNKTKKS